MRRYYPRRIDRRGKANERCRGGGVGDSFGIFLSASPGPGQRRRPTGRESSTWPEGRPLRSQRPLHPTAWPVQCHRGRLWVFFRFLHSVRNMRDQSRDSGISERDFTCASLTGARLVRANVRPNMEAIASWEVIASHRGMFLCITDTRRHRLSVLKLWTVWHG